MPNLNFTERVVKDRITKTFDVTSVHNDCYLGKIEWYSPWRRYCFKSITSHTVFDRNCLVEIVVFIDELMSTRSQSK